MSSSLRVAILGGRGHLIENVCERERARARGVS
jgi:hypothetical protein